MIKKFSEQELNHLDELLNLWSEKHIKRFIALGGDESAIRLTVAILELKGMLRNEFGIDE